MSIADETWRKGFVHLTVDSDGLVSLWDHPFDGEDVSYLGPSSYLRLPLTDEQRGLIEEAMTKSRTARALTEPVGTRVRAIARVYDLPGEPDPGAIHAEPGDTGTVVYVDETLGDASTVTFDRTGTSTQVTLGEVEVIP